MQPLLGTQTRWPAGGTPASPPALRIFTYLVPRNFSPPASLVSKATSLRACLQMLQLRLSPLLRGVGGGHGIRGGRGHGRGKQAWGLRSLAELDEVKDGEDSEDREEVTAETDRQRGKLAEHPLPGWDPPREDCPPKNRRVWALTLLSALHLHLGL